MTAIEPTIARLDDRGALHCLTRASRGIEKEALRVAADGALALTPHPERLGAPLTHPYITTDFSEAQLELITPTFDVPEAALAFLHDVHGYAYRNIGPEMLWTLSMPCHLPGQDRIPIAGYGPSHTGRMKNIYRRGLACRYGRAMQTISGIHYNFSPPADFWPHWAAVCGDGAGLPDDRSEAYFALIRNFRRHVWLLMYLFGASPAVCGSFLEGRDHPLERFTEDTWYLPHATSLRMSQLGYQNDAQSMVNVCYNTLESYLTSLRHAISTPYPEYARMGVRDNGTYRQLNDNILQIENEYYSTVRPKRVTRRGERPIRALAERGVEYVEVRCVDLNPYMPLGIDAGQARFLDLFLWHCLLAESPTIHDGECARLQDNQDTVVVRGREPGLVLRTADGVRPLPELAHELLDEIALLAIAADNHDAGTLYEECVAVERAKLDDPGRTPSGRIIDDMQRLGESHLAFGVDASVAHRDFFRDLAQDGEHWREIAAATQQSWQDKAAMEDADKGTFEDYLAAWFAQQPGMDAPP